MNIEQRYVDIETWSKSNPSKEIYVFKINVDDGILLLCFIIIWIIFIIKTLFHCLLMLNASCFSYL